MLCKCLCLFSCMWCNSLCILTKKRLLLIRRISLSTSTYRRLSFIPHQRTEDLPISRHYKFVIHYDDNFLCKQNLQHEDTSIEMVTSSFPRSFSMLWLSKRHSLAILFSRTSTLMWGRGERGTVKKLIRNISLVHVKIHYKHISILPTSPTTFVIGCSYLKIVLQYTTQDVSVWKSIIKLVFMCSFSRAFLFVPQGLSGLLGAKGIPGEPGQLVGAFWRAWGRLIFRLWNSTGCASLRSNLWRLTISQ